MLVSAALTEGTPRELIRLWRDGRFGLIVSRHLLYELQTVLSRAKFRRYLSYDEALRYVRWLGERAEIVDDPPEAEVCFATLDPDDDYLVGLVALNLAPYLVSGDRHLLDVGVVRAGSSTPNKPGGAFLARVLRPREFLEELGRFE